MSVDNPRGIFTSGGLFIPLVDGTDRVYDASNLFLGNPRKHLEDFREIVERFSTEKRFTQSTPVNPQECISYAVTCCYFASEMTERLNLAVDEGRTKPEMLKIEYVRQLGETTARRFALISTNPTKFLDASGLEITYAMYAPEPNPEDKKVTKVLRELDIIRPAVKYSLLTVGPPTGAFTDGPTKETMEMILRVSKMTPIDFYVFGIVETTYVIFEDGRVAKFITLPLPLLKGRALGIFDDIGLILKYANALSTMTTFDERKVIPSILSAFNKAIIESPHDKPNESA